MKIAEVIIGFHSSVGGYGRHVGLISEELRRRGHEVSVLSTKFSPASYNSEFGVKRFWNSRFLKLTPGLFNHLIKGDYDVVHVHGYPSFLPWISCLARQFKGFPLVFTPHYHPRGTKPLIFRRLFDKLFGERALKCADCLIALTDFEKGILERFNDNVTVIPNPVNLGSLKRIKGFKKKHGLRDYVLFIGRLEADKGVNFLIDAVSDLDVVIIGKDAGYLSKLKRKPNVHVIGEVSQGDLMSALTECSLLACPSKYEAFGIVFIEAMAYGKPVIGTKVGPVPSIVGRAGLTVPYGDVAALRQAINKVLRASVNFRKHALSQVKQYDVKLVVDNLERVYQGLIK